MQADRTDANNEPTKEVRQWNGIPLNITTKTGEPRFSFAPPMTCDYGCIRGTWGAGLDGKALDVYVVSDAPTVFKVVQITPAGAIDEYKYVLGAQSFDHAVETFLKHVPKQLFGAASQYSIAQLQNDIMQQSKVKKDADELTELVQQLEILIESDVAYGSNIYVLSFETASDGDITGKFKDAWNGRIFSYSVEKDRIGYKPALTLDRADSATAAKRFDIFSSGYTSLQVRQDAVKSGKKPRCTAVSYSCGMACIQLKNTCWINSSGQKVKKAGGAVASISQGRIDKLRTLAKYLAANGNNKWSKYGSAELLAAKAGNLEAKRANLFTKNRKKRVLSEIPVIESQTKSTTKSKSDGTHDLIPAGRTTENYYNPKVVDKVASLTGMSNYEAIESLTSINDFTRSAYKEIRETEYNNETSDETIAINRYLEKMPKFQGDIFRGKAIENKKELDIFIEKLQAGYSYKLPAMSSFSSSEDVGGEFAAANVTEQQEAVLFKVKNNKSGVTIKNLSNMPEENEVLVSKNAEYKISGKIETKTYQGRKVTIIPLEEY